MISKIPIIAKLAFGDEVTELCNNMLEVEKLLCSEAENKRAGAVALLSTQFDLPRDVLKNKLQHCLLDERSNMVNGTVHLYLRPLTNTAESQKEKAGIHLCKEYSLEAQMINIQHGSRIEKLGALKYAETNLEANPLSALKIFEYALKDPDVEIRCWAMSTMAMPYYATCNKEVATTYGGIALDPNEVERVRTYAAGIVLFIFGPYSLRPDQPLGVPGRENEKDEFTSRMRKIARDGLEGVDFKYIKNCIGAGERE